MGLQVKWAQEKILIKHTRGASDSGLSSRQPTKYYKKTYCRRKPRKRTIWWVKQQMSLVPLMLEVPPKTSQNCLNEFPLSVDRPLEVDKVVHAWGKEV
jgi:hypothetical protein